MSRPGRSLVLSLSSPRRSPRPDDDRDDIIRRVRDGEAGTYIGDILRVTRFVARALAGPERRAAHRLDSAATPR